MDVLAPVRAEIETVWSELERGWPAAGRKALLPALSPWDRDLIPALAVLAAGLYGREGDQVIALATTLERVHLATLVHNSIKHNPASPTLWGDYLFARTFDQVCRDGNFHLIGPMSELICTMQLAGVKRARSRDRATEIVAGEKGSLLAETMRITAALSPAGQAQARQLAGCGFCLGMCWGLADKLPGQVKEYAAQADAYLAQLPPVWQRGVLLSIVQALAAGDRAERSLVL